VPVVTTVCVIVYVGVVSGLHDGYLLIPDTYSGFELIMAIDSN